MLRRKIFLFLGSIVALLVLVAVAAIWLLQGVLHDLDHTSRVDAAAVDQVRELSAGITEIEIELRELQLDRRHHLDGLIEHVEFLRSQAAALDVRFERPVPGAKELCEHIRGLLPGFAQEIATLATTQDSQMVADHTAQALTVSIGLRKDIRELSSLMQEHVRAEEQAAAMWFRWLVLALAVAFLLVINISVMVLLRLAGMILRPVDRLVEASRQLAAEQFDYRVEVGEKGEFGELGEAFNRLGAALEAGEERKLETLKQVAVTLNHELNNASAAIQMQLSLLSRQSHGDPGAERCLRQIHESLERMSRTVEALKNVRRIVLTEYVSGTKMLDLERSVEDERELATNEHE